MFRLFLVTTAIGVSAGCASPAVSYCQRAARCMDEDATTCVNDARGGNEDAADYGCSAEHSALTGCLNQHSTCDDGVFTTDGSACGEEFQDELQCVIDASF
jgi:hypothetical protein